MAGLNPFNPTCVANICLDEVVGYNGSPTRQFALCTSQFGSPEVISVTLPVSVVFATTTTTVPYIDITVTTSTAFSTVKELTTSTVEVAETTTEFTATRVSTTTVEATAQVTFLRKIKKRKSPCKAPSSSSAITKSSIVPSSISSPPSSISSPPSSISPPPSSLSSPPLSLSSSVTRSATSLAACVDMEEYSSACSCIYAVGHETTVMVPASVSTITVTETASSAVPTISTTVVTDIVTESSTQLTTSTATTTVKTIADTTSTATNLIQPTVTAAFRTNPLNKGLVMNVGNRYAGQTLSNAGVGTQLRVNAGTGQVSISGQPTVQLYANFLTTTYAILKFNTPAQVTSADKTLTCFPNSAGVLSCNSGDGFNTVFSCASYIYIAKPDWVFSGCTAVKIGLSTT